MSEQDYSTVITTEERPKGMSGWWIVLIVTIVVLFCCCCISIFAFLVLISNVAYEFFNQITYLFA
jgi:hypothetical protein